MKRNKIGSIRRKLTARILLTTIIAVSLVTTISFTFMFNMKKVTLEITSNDVANQVAELSSNKAELADSMLVLSQNQTILMAQGVTDVLANADTYLAGYNENNLPDLSCANKDTIGYYSVYARVPEYLLTDITKDASGTVVDAKINREVSLNGKYTVNQELYLMSLLTNEFAQINRFMSEDGSYKGFAATYFCFDDSGIDVLGEINTTAMIQYDARERGWYKAAVEAWKNGTLTEYGVYWSEPVLDGSGRGISMICAMPVVVDGKLLGVAASGGLLTNFTELIENSTIGETGYSLMVDSNTGKVIINPKASEANGVTSEIMQANYLQESDNKEIKKLADSIIEGESGSNKSITIDGNECMLTYTALKNNDWTMITVISRDDNLVTDSYNTLNRRIRYAMLMFGVMLVILILVVVLVAGRLSMHFTEPILKLKNGAAKIGAGELDNLIAIKTDDEIEELGDTFNKMAKNLDEYIKNLAYVTAEKERVGAELNVATQIQKSMLPCIFPAFPEIKEIDIYASMDPAKEVGGDFYDFFMVDDRHLAIVMADVSGKGVPAALFMVIGKTLIKDHTTPGRDLGEVFTEVNNLLCESNSEGLFITAFEGVLDIVTGEFRFVNAGHELPFICKNGENFAPYQVRRALVLAGMEDMKYKSGVMQLEPGDRIFQYTDGVTEATNSNNELYGMERLENVLNNNKNLQPNELLPAVKADIDRFVGEAPQFDDITMLCLEFKEYCKIEA